MCCFGLESWFEIIQPGGGGGGGFFPAGFLLLSVCAFARARVWVCVCVCLCVCVCVCACVNVCLLPTTNGGEFDLAMSYLVIISKPSLS